MEHRKNIALFIGMLETQFTHDICEGALLGAKELDMNLFVMPGGFIHGQYPDDDFNTYRAQYNTLYPCVQSNAFDAVIIEYGSITSLLNEEQKSKFLKQFEDVPTILLAGKREGYSSISIDNKIGIQEVVSHLIELHHCRKIGFISGPKTNQDARERLEAYKETMQQHDLEVPKNWIAYGDFSEYHPEIVEEFILKNPDIEAIVFANDQMALSSYNVMKKLHLETGKDILVTGFDDEYIAMLSEPHLTTIKVDAREMGYRAVIECPKIIAGEEIHTTIRSHMIVRESCGCNDYDIVNRTIDVLNIEMQGKLARMLADDVFEKYFDIYYENEDKIRVKQTVEEYFEYYFHLIREDGTLNLDKKEFERQYRKYMQTCMDGYINLKNFFLIDNILYGYVRTQIKDDHNKLLLLEQVSTLSRELLNNMTTRKHMLIEQGKSFDLVLSNIVSDMIQNSIQEQKRYESFIRKLQRLEFSSGVIYVYENGIGNSWNGEWEMPEHFYVKAYYNRDEIHLYRGLEKKVGLESIFSAEFLPADRRLCMMTIPLFADEVQYGFLLIESELETFQYAMQIACQMSISIKILELVKKQNEIKNELEESLARSVASNKILDEMSKIDPLTGISNRRGFFDTINLIIKDANNHGKKAIAVYADMDNLKVINDEFGHKEGDFALKAIADILTESFRKSDVIGRMGGDEFAVFAIANQQNMIEIIENRIKKEIQDFNMRCEKQYYVDFSVGMYEFQVEEGINLEHILNEADARLYQDKKQKKKTVYKWR